MRRSAAFETCDDFGRKPTGVTVTLNADSPVMDAIKND